ncbi:MAG: hypothetical protein KDB85_04005 [Chitinophagales bacterium]|nr:hypothetical protein [Chitinophagales bacterium]
MLLRLSPLLLLPLLGLVACGGKTTKQDISEDLSSIVVARKSCMQGLYERYNFYLEDETGQRYDISARLYDAVTPLDTVYFDGQKVVEIRDYYPNPILHF